LNRVAYGYSININLDENCVKEGTYKGKRSWSCCCPLPFFRYCRGK